MSHFMIPTKSAITPIIANPITTTITHPPGGMVMIRIANSRHIKNKANKQPPMIILI